MLLHSNVPLKRDPLEVAALRHEPREVDARVANTMNAAPARPTMQHAARVLVVADGPDVRNNLIARLDAGVTIRACAEADAQHCLVALNATVVVWDLGPNTPALAAVRDANFNVPIIALCSHRGAALDLLAAGACAVLERDVTREALHSALVSVRAGLKVVQPNLLALDERNTSNIARQDVRELTRREHEVLSHLASGLSNKKIGVELGISSHTAKFHIGAILTKLGASTRTEAVVRAVQLGIVQI